MTIENVYSYLEYLTLTVDQLADAVIEREEETAFYETQLGEINSALLIAKSDLDKSEARAQLAEAKAKRAEEKVEELSLMLKAFRHNKRGSEAQTDLFAPPSAPPPQPVSTKSDKVANDANALILAKKLDSTIDKVQKLIREARA